MESDNGKLIIKVHCPAAANVKVFLNGTERTEIETDGNPVEVRVLQVLPDGGAARGEKLRVYYGSVFGRKLRYGTDVESPFHAGFEGTIRAGEEGTVGFTLTCMEGRYRIYPERECFVEGSVRSYERNEDSGLWKLVLGSVLLPLLIILLLAFRALGRSDAPVAAKAAFGILYGILMIGAIGLFFYRTRHTRYYSTGVEHNE
ncbi:MAG: hypothetical protein J6S78_03485 [Lachnospiraceae bacterium]|nr:hypothetical protein [Lachnospiraceae bacterium]